MLKYLLLFIPVFLACPSVEVPVPAPAADIIEGDRGFWDMTPRDNELVFIGVAGFHLDQDAALRLALEDAARKAALFHAVRARSLREEYIGSGFLDYRYESASVLDFNQNYRSYVEQLRFDSERDIRMDRWTVFVRARFTAPYEFRVFYERSAGPGKPRWVSFPPVEISGFLAGVGFANPRLAHKDTVIASYENAILSLIDRVSNTMHIELVNSGDSGSSAPSSIRSSSLSSASLEGFYVLDVWVEPETRAVWTLAIAREGKAQPG
jgi:hypothetical protein